MLQSSVYVLQVYVLQVLQVCTGVLQVYYMPFVPDDVFCLPMSPQQFCISYTCTKLQTYPDGSAPMGLRSTSTFVFLNQHFICPNKKKGDFGLWKKNSQMSKVDWFSTFKQESQGLFFCGDLNLGEAFHHCSAPFFNNLQAVHTSWCCRQQIVQHLQCEKASFWR